MIIRRMTASFGRLDHETLELEKGLNILTLPNEGGKSTWCAFLRVILYGLNTRERDKKGFLADKSHYLPWSGAPMEGELLCEWQGRELLVRRYTKNGVPMGGFEAVWADTGDPVPGLTADNLGDVLVGVGRSVFERSAFLGQSALAVSQAPELEKRLSALASSGEDGVSASQVRGVLTDWQRSRRFRSRGEIPALEARRQELSRALDAVHDVTAEILRHQVEIDNLQTVEQGLAHQLELYRAMEEDEQAQAYARAEAELRRSKAQLEKLRGQMPSAGPLPPREELEKGRDDVTALRTLDANLKQVQSQIPVAQAALEQARAAAADSVFSGSASDARSRARDAQRQYEAAEQKKKSAGVRSWLFPVLGAVAGAGAFAVLYFALGLVLSVSVAVGAVLLAAGIVLGLTTGRRRKKAEDAAMREILDCCHVTVPTELSAAAERYCAGLEDVRRAQEALDRAQKSRDDLQNQRDALWNGLRDLVTPFAPEVQDVFGFSAAITKNLTLLDDIASARQDAESARKLFDAVSAHGKGAAEDGLEKPSVSRKRAEEGRTEARRRIALHRSELDRALGRRSTLGEPEDIQAELDAVDRDLERLRADYDALEIALEVLDQAEDEMRERFSPRLNRLAGDYFRRLTDEKYDKVRISRELDVAAEEAGGVVSREALFLSQGTVDQLWLAVRLAVCDLTLPKEDPCPLVLDDALANFDDVRLIPALDLLEELSRKRQILLFSCHEREQIAFAHRRAAGGGRT